MLLEQAEMQSKHETEIKDSRKRFDTSLQDLDKKLSESQSQLSETTEFKRSLETELRDTK